MDVVSWVSGKGGVVRSSAARRAGYSERSIRRGLEDGLLVRPRGGWLALASADPELLAAARAGVILTCLTGAKKLGLWVLTADRPHVAAPAHSGAVSARGAHVHWARPLVPRPPGTLIDAIENVLVLVASCRPFEEALAVWESALRLGKVERAALAQLPLPSVARALLDAASSFSDSGLESFVVPRLRWLKLPIVPQAWIAGHRVDFLIGDRLILQIDGGHHVGAQREEDIAHDAQLMLLGYHVIRVGYWQVIDRWHEVQDVIMRAVAQGLHLATRR
jgi:very-short-patch-repair endonuclease